MLLDRWMGRLGRIPPRLRRGLRHVSGERRGERASGGGILRTNQRAGSSITKK